MYMVATVVAAAADILEMIPIAQNLVADHIPVQAHDDLVFVGTEPLLNARLG